MKSKLKITREIREIFFLWASLMFFSVIQIIKDVCLGTYQFWIINFESFKIWNPDSVGGRLRFEIIKKISLILMNSSLMVPSDASSNVVTRHDERWQTNFQLPGPSIFPILWF